MEAVATLLAISAAIAFACFWSPAPLFNRPPSPHKPHVGFPAFYALYLSQHRQPLTKVAHAVGTTSFLFFCYGEPGLLLAVAAAVAAGSFLCPLFRHHAHGGVEGAGFLAAYLAAGRWATGGWRAVALAPLSAYFWAWVGHFFVEHNRPATFIYPSYSLLGDFRMLAELATLQLAWDGSAAERAPPRRD